MKWPESINQFIKENYLGTGHQAMADKINKRFGTQYTKAQIKNFYSRHKLNSGLTGHFKKGHVPANKGKKLSPENYKKVEKTMFKKGDKPHNILPVGSVIMRSDGYLAKKIAEPNK